VTAIRAVVEQPRPFGYVVGDLIEQRVLLQAASHAVDLASLPRPARLNVWLERRQPRIAADSQGRHWLVVDYQLINAPQGLTTVNLPAWQLATKSGQSLSIPQWPVSVGPLTARKVIAQGGLQELRADRPAPSVPTEPIVQQIEIWSGALLLTLALWGGWLGWRNWRDALDRPFARAAREMRGVAEDAPQAWQALHRAFDRAAGRVIQTSTLGSLFERASYLEPLRPRIEEFFAQSVAYFFGDASGAQPAASVHARTSLRALSVRALCNDLRKIERRVQP
jgi:mxaA protein